MKRSAFDRFHPAVAGVYFAVLLCLSMAAMQPVYVLISFVAAFAYSVVLRGAHAAVRTLAWQIPLIVVISLVNPLFSASGSTELFRLGEVAFYLESFIYGACMGAMLAGVLLSFSNASRVLTSDKIMALFGGLAPTIGLMLSMTARLVPQFARRGRTIGTAEQACTAARTDAPTAAAGARGAEKKEGRRMRIRQNLRLISVLMGWSMEDSLETADAMKARGWGASAQRSTYARFRFRRYDAAALVFLGVLAVLAAAAAWVACAQIRFYPTIAGFAPWLNYVPYALFAVLPLIMEARERLIWKS